MEIVLEELQYQLDALEAINKNFPKLDLQAKNANECANPLIQNRGTTAANIDIKMETGTGKTYVYTRMMYELHQRYGMFKFVIVVPSPAIKEGTKKFIQSNYAKQHFSEYYENTHIQLNVINAGDFNNKSGRHNFPAQLIEFVETSCSNTNQIEVLLINAGMLNSKSMNSSNYDQMLAGGETNPLQAIAATRPIVIIDEPHRFSSNTKGYKAIQRLNPQSIIRFGATFPFKVEGKGKNKKRVVDYFKGKPQFNLNAIDSFNQGLVKGIDIFYPNIPKEQAEEAYTVKSTSKNELVLRDYNNKDHVIPVNSGIESADSRFEGNIIYEGGNQKEGKLSNELIVSPGMKLIPGTFTASYQEKIIDQAIKEHFKNERLNFLRKGPKIKTLSLFFIDNINSYGRKKVNGHGREKGWLINIFERLLSKNLNEEIRKFNLTKSKREEEYKDFLKATLQSLNSNHQQVYAGYFSDDRGTKDEDIEAEVNDILKNKEKMLSFKDKNGNWITRRFLFSKWTLREGWDNPNVFVIAKLRSSGSENSKIQEVGRGLRLPVDENGNRVHQNEFESRLSFLIGYDEKEFAQKLIGEINDDATIKVNTKELTSEMIQLIVNNRKINDPSFDKEKLLEDLIGRKIINFSYEFKKDLVQLNGREYSAFDAFCQLYPEVNNNLLSNDKVRNMNNHPQSIFAKLNKNNWNKLKDIWLKLVKRTMIAFDHNQDTLNLIDILMNKVFADQENYVLDHTQLNHEKIDFKKNIANVNKEIEEINNQYSIMNYGKFLKQIALETSLNPSLIHKKISLTMKKLNNDKRYINEKTMNNLIKDFNDRFNFRFKNNYHYIPLQFSASTSVYDYEKNDFVDKVSANDIGIHSIDGQSDDLYLYDRPPLRYDSEHPELDILRRNYQNQKVSVYGKLPKKSIKIPRYDHGTTTPDFIFKIETQNQSPKYLIIETKSENRRESDNQIVQIQKKYFEELHESNIYYKMATSAQEVQEAIYQIKGEK